MNMDCFLKRFSDVLLNDKNDGVFDTLKLIIGGTTSSRTAKLLNFAVSQMDDNECYVEVGVFTGGTLCSANHQNIKNCVGIDKFDEFEIGKMTDVSPSKIKERCLFNIASLGQGKTRLIDKDFRNVTKDEIGMPVAVSFIDGTHSYEDVMKNLEFLEPLLADNAVILFDDVNYEEVSRAIFEWLSTHQDQYDLLAYVKPYYQDNFYISSLNERFMNNGVCVMRYHKRADHKALILSDFVQQSTKGATC